MFNPDANRHIYAGTNEFYRFGRKAREKVSAHLAPNSQGFYSIPVNGGKYWSFGTSEGKYGEYAKYKDVFFSVNRAGNLWAKEGTPKGVAFVQMLTEMLSEMEAADAERIAQLHYDDEEE